MIRSILAYTCVCGEFDIRLPKEGKCMHHYLPPWTKNMKGITHYQEYRLREPAKYYFKVLKEVQQPSCNTFITVFGVPKNMVCQTPFP